MLLAEPLKRAPFRYLFLDLNSYFASVEQQENPALRGKPVGVVPMPADSTCLIAASYEAKRFGLHTGMRVFEAKRLCPEIHLVEARHRLYVEYHERVVEAVESVVPVEKVCSIDEMRIRLLESEGTEEAALDISRRIKQAIRERVGHCLTCSIGLAPNAFLAKVASDMQKPDGLVLLRPEELEHKLRDLKVTDFPGINRRMAVRLNLAGIYTAEQMLRASEKELRQAFGSVVGGRWWYLLRGHDLPDEETKRRSLGNSHVLPPEFRTKEGSYQVLLRLINKAAACLRREELAARGVTFSAHAKDQEWSWQGRLEATRDTLAVMERLKEAWKTNSLDKPSQVGVTFFDLIPAGQMTLSLFDKDNGRSGLAAAVDGLNQRFGKNTVLPAGLVAAKDTAEEKIAFRKVSLFDEGTAA